MAFRTSARLALATLGVAAFAGAGQLGVAYGLGIVRLTRAFDVTTRDQWTTQLAWVAWIAMISAVVGGLFAVTARADRPARHTGPPPPAGAAPRTGAGSTSAAALARTGALADRTWRRDGPRLGAGAAIPLALAAAVGAAIVVPLTTQPARSAQIAGIHPVLVIGLTAGLGALVGVFAAIAAMMHPVARWSLTTVGLIMWAVAVISVAPSFSPSDPLPEIRLGVFDAGFLSHPAGQRIALLTMPVVALLVGLMLGAVARRQKRSTLTIALAGLPGPALLTLAYLIAGPGTGTERYQVVPYWAAMTATGAGVLGSVLAVIIRRGPEEDEDEHGMAGQPPLPGRERPDEPTLGMSPTDPAGFGSSPDGSPTGDGYPSAGGSTYGAGPTYGGSTYGGYPPAGGSPYGGGFDLGSDWRVPDQRGAADSDRPGQPSASHGGTPSAAPPVAPWSGYLAGPASTTSTLAAPSTQAGPSDLGRPSDPAAPWNLAPPSNLAGPSTLARPSNLAGFSTLAEPSNLAGSSSLGGPLNLADQDESGSFGRAKESLSGRLRGFGAGLRRRATAAPAEPAAPPAAPSPTPWRPEPVVRMGKQSPTPLTTPPVAPPPIAPPPVAPPPVTPVTPVSPGKPDRPESRGTAADKRRGGKQQDEDYVDWVSGLGG